ncbi:MAG TPA: geranylgeranyl reductase family protein [Flavilitoribacter sp.]|nr:geranylgeranyl reductase family protein [Flavilitoribacter sp.]HMQ87241.1 geranylgeranyl reductase family protein [Flavilitoribacter sp.]
MLHSDICIVGAGPGGAACALKLSYAGIPCILLDKAEFPRDKICGDAVSGKVTTLLNRLDPEILKRFNTAVPSVGVWGIRFLAPNGRVIDVPFNTATGDSDGAPPGYVCRRLDFDRFLTDEIARRPNIDFRPSSEATAYNRTGDGWEVVVNQGERLIGCRLLIIADGAHSSFSRKTAGLEKDPRHHAAALRAYYKGVTGFSNDQFIELHFIREITPGYFWIFPLPDGHANVGIGMRSDILKQKKVNLNRVLDDLIAHHPLIRDRFAAAERTGPVTGYGLPLGSKERSISGDGFMLVGDAGHLIDPLTGEGIGNAFYSGFIAADQAVNCLQANDFSAEAMKAYDVRVARVLGSEMKLSRKLQEVMRYPAIVNLMGYVISGNRKMLKSLSDMYTDFNLRERLLTPFFWFKMLFARKNGPKSP